MLADKIGKPVEHCAVAAHATRTQFIFAHMAHFVRHRPYSSGECAMSSRVEPYHMPVCVVMLGLRITSDWNGSKFNIIRVRKIPPLERRLGPKQFIDRHHVVVVNMKHLTVSRPA